MVTPPRPIVVIVGGVTGTPPCRPRTSPHKGPTPHRRSHHHRTLQPVGGLKSPPCAAAIPPMGALLDPSFNDPDSTVPTTDLSSEPTKMPPATAVGRSLGKGKTTRRCTHHTRAHRPRGAQVTTSKRGDEVGDAVGQLGFCPSHPRGATQGRESLCLSSAKSIGQLSANS
jgi:hypothetical protein